MYLATCGLYSIIFFIWWYIVPIVHLTLGVRAPETVKAVLLWSACLLQSWFLRNETPALHVHHFLCTAGNINQIPTHTYTYMHIHAHTSTCLRIRSNTCRYLYRLHVCACIACICRYVFICRYCMYVKVLQVCVGMSLCVCIACMCRYVQVCAGMSLCIGIACMCRYRRYV